MPCGTRYSTSGGLPRSGVKLKNRSSATCCILLCGADRPSRPGMYGSGMIVINPPCTLVPLPFLAAELGMNDKAGFRSNNG